MNDSFRKIPDFLVRSLLGPGLGFSGVIAEDGHTFSKYYIAAF